jgi:hypothetical protein
MVQLVLLQRYRTSEQRLSGDTVALHILSLESRGCSRAQCLADRKWHAEINSASRRTRQRFDLQLRSVQSEEPLPPDRGTTIPAFVRMMPRPSRSKSCAPRSRSSERM